MTDQTVLVPLDLLKRLFDNTTLTRDAWEGDSVEVRPSAIGALIDIKALIPKPYKVGDVVDVAGGTDAAMAALPPRTVLTDRDGDLVVAFGEGTNGSPARRITDGGRQTDAFITSYYAPYTIVYLPEESK